MRSSFLSCLLLVVVPGCATAQTPDGSKIVIGTRDSIWSPTLKEYRQFLVYTPPSYRDTSYVPQKYPVLYLLDGDAHFHSVTGLIQILGTGVNGTLVVPEMIVVAIPNTNRTRDLTPTHTDKDLQGKPQAGFKVSGGAPNFLKFVKAELIPRIDSSYRTAPYRVFVGHSFGGITAIDALYTMPETFSAYVAIDPSLWWDNRVLLRQAKDFFSKPGLAGKVLYVGQANTLTGADTTDNVHFNSIIRFNRILEEYNKSGLRYAYKYYPEDDHGSVPLIAEYDALRFIFAPYKLNRAIALDRPAYVKEHFAAVSAALGYPTPPPERLVDLLARQELARDTVKAIEFYQLNADLYPSSPQGYKATIAKLRGKKGSGG
jgi:predicted alpha/beta superfamily hydrolase